MRLNTKNVYVLPTKCIYVFCMDLRINNDYNFSIQRILTGSYNLKESCLLRG